MTGGLTVLMMNFCNLTNYLKIYKSEEIFDPAFLNLDENDKDAWKVYADRIRNIFSKVRKLQKVNTSQKDYYAFRAIMMERIEKLRGYPDTDNIFNYDHLFENENEN